MNDDELLLAQIEAHAGYAEQAKPRQVDLPAIAAVLSHLFEHRSEKEILEQLRTVFRARGLLWRE